MIYDEREKFHVCENEMLHVCENKTFRSYIILFYYTRRIILYEDLCVVMKSTFYKNVNVILHFCKYIIINKKNNIIFMINVCENVTLHSCKYDNIILLTRRIIYNNLCL